MTDERVVHLTHAEDANAIYRVVDLDPCGECPKGECDHCDGCEWAAEVSEKPE